MRARTVLAFAGIAVALAALWGLREAERTPVVLRGEGAVAAPEVDSAEIGPRAPRATAEVPDSVEALDTPVRERARPTPAVVRLRFEYPDGEPVPSGRVALHVPDPWTISTGVIDADGVVEVEQRPGEDLLSAAGPFLPLVARSLSELGVTADTVAAGQVGIVTAERGGVLAGRVVYRGPQPSLPLVLRLDPMPDRTALEVLNGVLQQALQGTGLGTRRQTVTAEGTFRFEGLAGSWTGTIVLPDGCEALDATDHARAGTEDHLLVVCEQPCLVGRLLAADGTVVRLGGVSARQVSMRSRSGRSMIVRDDGRFRVPLKPDSPSRVDLVLIGKEPRGHRELVLPDVDTHGRTDLGDLVLEPAFDVEVLVVDPAGAPIPGAAAEMEGVDRSPSTRTGPDGRTRLEGVPASCTELVVSGAGRRTARVPAPEGGGSVRVSLESTAAFDVRIAPSADVYLGAMRVRLLAPADPVVDAVHWKRVAGHRGEPGYDGVARGRREDGSWELSVEVDPRGRATFDGLVEDLPLAVEVVDTTGYVVRRLGPMRLGAAERRRVEVELEAPSTLEGIVVGEGLPVASAQVTLVGSSTRDWTDDRGRFAIPCVSAPSLSFDVTADGYAPRRLADVPRPAPGEVLRVELSTGRRVRVHVVDAAGMPLAVDLDRIVARSELGPPVYGGRAGAPGEYELADLAPIAYRVEAEVHGRPYATRLEAEADAVTLRLPEGGTLEVRWDPGLDLTGSTRLVGKGSRGETTLSVEVGPEADGVLRVHPVFPDAYDLELVRDPRRSSGRELHTVAVGICTVRVGETTEVVLEQR